MFVFIFGALFASHTALAQNKNEKSFSAVITDANGIETDVKNVLFTGKRK
jgi:hypothetical protein